MEGICPVGSIVPPGKNHIGPQAQFVVSLQEAVLSVGTTRDSIPLSVLAQCQLELHAECVHNDKEEYVCYAVYRKLSWYSPYPIFPRGKVFLRRNNPGSSK